MTAQPSSVAEADQLAAAAVEADAVIRRMAGPLHGEIRTGMAVEDWMRAMVDRHNAAVAAGAGRGCRHVRGPGLYLTAAWRPGVLACRRCAPTWLQPVNDRDNWTCDRCRQYRPGQVAVSAIQAQAAIIMVGLCRTCRP